MAVSRRSAARLAWSIAGIGVVLAISGVLVAALGGAQLHEDFAPFVVASAVLVVSSAVGGIVASKQPQNPIGWVLCAFGAVWGATTLASGYAEVAPDEASSGAGQMAAWLSNWAWVFFFALAVSVLLLFPDGRLPSPRWKAAAWCGALGIVALTAGAALQPGDLEDYPGVTNPVGLSGGVAEGLLVAGMLTTAAALAAGVAAVVVRYLHADGVARQQIKWLTVAAVFAVAGVALGGVLLGLGRDDIGNTVILLGILCIPLAIGVAILRYRLYEIDRVISKTLVYAGLTVLLGAAYAGLVVAGQEVFSSVAGGGDLVIAVSTLVVTALFLPLRSRLQRVVDRRFYRRRYDAQRTLESFGVRLREHVDLETLSVDLRGVVAETVQPAHLSLWLRSGR
jgi:hypothetical protein